MNANQLKARLLERDLTLTAWATGHGYNPRTVGQVVTRWVTGRRQRRDRLPKGRVAYSILRDLSRDIGAEVIPGVLAD